MNVSPRAAGIGAALVVVAILSFLVWDCADDRGERRRSLAEERVRVLEVQKAKLDSIIEAQDRALAEKDRELAAARAATDTVTVTVREAGSAYGREREKVRPDLPQPSGVPAGYVVVPRSYVVAADSMAARLPRMLQAMERERLEATARIMASNEAVAARDSAIAVRDLQIVELRELSKANRPKWTDKVKWALVGAGVGALAQASLGN